MRYPHEGTAMGHRIRKSLASLLLAIVALVLAGVDAPRLPPPVPLAADQPSSAVTGQLIIESQGIERITLVKKGARNLLDQKDWLVLDRPAPAVSVPAGEYWLKEITFKSGLACTPPDRMVEGPTGPEFEGEAVTIRPDVPWTLKAGGPLKSTLLARRTDRKVRIDYYVVDSRRRVYTLSHGARPPRFTVYCDGQVVDSGSLEYG
jgi:hypothetical protein